MSKFDKIRPYYDAEVNDGKEEKAAHLVSLLAQFADHVGLLENLLLQGRLLARQFVAALYG